MSDPVARKLDRVLRLSWLIVAVTLVAAVIGLLWK